MSKIEPIRCIHPQDLQGVDVQFSCIFKVDWKTVTVELWHSGPWQFDDSDSDSAREDREDWCSQFGWKAVDMLEQDGGGFTNRAILTVCGDGRVELCEPRPGPGMSPKVIRQIGFLTSPASR